MNAILGILFAGAFGGSTVGAQHGAAFFLDFQAPFWAALGVFPVYLIGKEVSSRRMGLMAALLYPVVVASIDSSTFGYANYLSFYTFFILIALYGYLRTVKAAGSRRWVEDYRQPRQFWPALKSYYNRERSAVKWAVFTGVAFGTVMLAWQGYSFLVAAVVVFLVIQMVIERIRRVDSFGLYVLTWIVGLVGFPMAVPYYYFQGLGRVWFDQPALVFFGALLVLLPFFLLRDTPWVVSVPVLLGTALAAIGALFAFDPGDFTAIITGQGYFVKTLVYSTVAEAQAPSIDSLILGYGVVTFFLAFVGLGLYVWRTVRDRFRRIQVMFIVFAILSIYLPLSAAKFFFIGSAGFALLPAEAIIRALDVGGYPALRRNVASLSDRRSQFAAFRRSVKGRHVLVLTLVILILVPNIWYSIDAGIPYNNKGTYSSQIYNSLPAPLRSSPSNASSYYLGAAGTELDTPNQYDEAGYNWLAAQDTQLPEPQRPAFVSWWDYGFQAVAEGNHPTVADNFQNGIDPAGNFLLSQNESQAIAILSTTLLAGEQVRSGQPYLPPALNALLARDGVNVGTVHNLMVNQSQDIAMVIGHPDRYLSVDPSHLDGQNAMYDAMAYYLATALPTNGVAQVYNDVQAYTHWSIRYAMVDSRLFPFSGSNTGIFYAPADLTDRVIGAGGAPTAYYTLSVLGSDGNTYSPSSLPAGVTAVQYNINYLPAFYSSMIYRIFVGYNGTDIGASAQGIPGLTNNAVGADPPEPGWMLSHFQVVYRTAYFCPQPNATAGSSCFSANNLPTVKSLAKDKNGTGDTSTNSYYGGGEAMLEYYPGQPLTGTVLLPDGTPVSGARVTVYDSWGIPHMTTVTGSNGSYSVLLPPGNDRVNVSTGSVNGLTQAGGTPLAGLNVTVPNATGLSLDAPTMVSPIVVRPATVSGFVYWNTANNSTFIRSTDPVVSGATATLAGTGLSTRNATTDASGAFEMANVPPGVYNFTVTYRGATFHETNVFALPGKTANQSVGLSPGTVTGRVHFATGFAAPQSTISVADALGVVATATSDLNGNFTIRDLPPGNYTLSAKAPGVSLGSVGTVLAVTAGGKANVSLTLVPLVTIAEPVVLNGNPVAGFPVRFTELSVPTPNRPAPTNASGPPSASGPTAARANSSVFLTGPDGVVRATIPLANYSVYSFGLNGSSWYAGFTTVYLNSTATAVLPTLALSNAVQLSGAVTGAPSTSAGPASTQVTIYDGSGHQVSTFANISQSYSIWLPAGQYTVQGSSGVPNSSAPPVAFLGTVALPYSTVLPIALGPGEVVSGVVAAPSSGGAPPFPAARAVVTFTEVPLNATVTAVADSRGNVSVILPARLPTGASYCIAATASGFLPYRTCSYTPAELGSLGELPVALARVPFNLTVNGLPTGTSLTVNFTAVSGPASTTTKVGGPNFAFSIVPGSYRVTAWAKPTSGPGLWLPAGPANLTVPIGGSSANLSFSVLGQVVAKGQLVLLTNVSDTSVTLRLFSPRMNETVNGATFLKGFYVAPGTYSVYATAPNGANGTAATMTSVVVNATGHLSRSISLTTLGVPIAGSLVTSSGAPLNATVALTVSGPSGVSTTVTATGGHFTATLPPNSTYPVHANATVLVSGPSGSAYEAVAVAPTFAGCAVGPGPNATCLVPFVTSTVHTSVAGTLRAAGFANPLPGTVELVGPTPSTNATVLRAPNGTFAASLLPGNYSIYARASNGVPYANVSWVVVTTAAVRSLTVTLSPTWTDTVTIVPPSTSSAQFATLTVTSPGGAVLALANQPTGTPIPLALPPGTYKVASTTTGVPYGVAVNATASVAVALLYGNLATQLTLAYQFVSTVDFTTAAPTSVTVPAGSTVTFAYTVRNTGNEPANLTFVGSPAFWNFTFSPASVVLGVTGRNSSVGGEVRIVVPSGTNTLQPSVQLEAENAVTKAPVGFAQPVPTISIIPVLGLSIGPVPSIGATVGPYQASIPFYLLNTGNFVEGTSLTIADSSRLAAIGWTAVIHKGTGPAPQPNELTPGSNTTFTVVLTSPARQALPPGSVTVVASVSNLSGALTRSVTLTVPALTVGLSNSTAIVTGPNLGSPSPYPTWLVPVLVFVPAAAFLVAAGVYRWVRTRRWTRR
ncbi:MAG TPA: carboxypeptidase regulatory-like domain-containing protein [Thermoplasmata archaeon]|nr:carboxypeptidase regulatory-like domain-containing protein [Thermoplasmata archaeon]